MVEDVLSPAEHDRVVAWVRATLAEGRAGALPGSTYAPIPDKWRARNQSREMLQFGAYTHSNRVEAHVPVAPLEGTPLERVVDALVLAGCFEGAAFERPNACTVNDYRPGQWIPPHVDNPAFARPPSPSPSSHDNPCSWDEASPGRTPGARTTQKTPRLSTPTP